MTEPHLTNGSQITPKTPYIRRVIDAAERRSIQQTSDSTPLRNRFVHQPEMIAIWSFVAFCFAVFIFGLWAIHAKCRGDWPPSISRNHGTTTPKTNPIERSR